MEYTPFSSLKVTTMTLIIELQGMVDIGKAFLLLPITRVFVPPSRSTRRCKLPYYGVPGIIISARHRGMTRGIIRSQSDKFFKNAVTLDVGTSTKNISLKLSPSNIQMCGSTSITMGVDAAQHVINHLHHIQDTLDYMHQNSELTHKTVEWIKLVTKGFPAEKWIERTITIEDDVTFVVHDRTYGHKICHPYQIPVDIDRRIVTFLLSFIHDFYYYEDYIQKLEYVLQLDKIIDKPFGLSSVREAMVNYNFNLGFQVDRISLSNLMHGRDGFIAHFDNVLMNHVSIVLPYEVDPNTHRKRDATPHHSFMVHRTGSVTQSGPGKALMEEAYNRFMTQILQIRHLIEYNPESPKLPIGLI